MLCLLVNREMSVGQINKQLPDLSQSALSQHLAKLREEGPVLTRHEAPTIWYTLKQGPVEQIITTLYGIYCTLDAQSNQLHASVSASGATPHESWQAIGMRRLLASLIPDAREPPHRANLDESSA